MKIKLPNYTDVSLDISMIGIKNKMLMIWREARKVNYGSKLFLFCMFHEGMKGAEFMFDVAFIILIKIFSFAGDSDL